MFSGWTPSDWDELTYSDAMILWEAHQAGLAGPMKDYTIAYTLGCQLHNVGQITYLSNAKKGTKPEKPPQFEELYPRIYEITTGESIEQKKIKDMAYKSAVQLGMPAHVWRHLNGSTETDDDLSGSG